MVLCCYHLCISLLYSIVLSQFHIANLAGLSSWGFAGTSTKGIPGAAPLHSRTRNGTGRWAGTDKLF